ncbi:MAG: thrombospondin type 3 repeat-containing protein, partial [Deltaproteobacteria bacterium]|nr:thrombospondin type 3 repeat-containing protein [Deltaproteobacteria bacterium]
DPTNDLCDNDSDDDGIPDSFDRCAFVASDNNDDSDGDFLGDACDPDLDNDGVPNSLDNCTTTPNANQLNADRDGFGDSCDSSFCFVVDSPDSGRCLNPNSRFFGRPGPDMIISVSELVRLRIFTNRPGAPTQYAWRVTKSPEGGAYEVSNPTGMVRQSTPWEFHYDADREATFVARSPGEYEVELQTTLVFDDVAYPGLTADKQVMKIKVDGAVGCNSFGSSTPLAWMLLGGLALLGWRRRS